MVSSPVDKFNAQSSSLSTQLVSISLHLRQEYFAHHCNRNAPTLNPSSEQHFCLVQMVSHRCHNLPGQVSGHKVLDSARLPTYDKIATLLSRPSRGTFDRLLPPFSVGYTGASLTPTSVMLKWTECSVQMRLVCVGVGAKLNLLHCAKAPNGLFTFVAGTAVRLFVYFLSPLWSVD